MDHLAYNLFNVGSIGTSDFVRGQRQSSMSWDERDSPVDLRLFFLKQGGCFVGVACDPSSPESPGSIWHKRLHCRASLDTYRISTCCSVSVPSPVRSCKLPVSAIIQLSSLLPPSLLSPAARRTRSFLCLNKESAGVLAVDGILLVRVDLRWYKVERNR